MNSMSVIDITLIASFIITLALIVGGMISKSNWWRKPLFYATIILCLLLLLKTILIALENLGLV
ncbi:MAG TPA: hypothetical protein ENG44_01120 [Desulfurococcaceae archaeon]|nr:hypothetical protein [Desulfurococcaceae archaeon]